MWDLSSNAVGHRGAAVPVPTFLAEKGQCEVEDVKPEAVKQEAANVREQGVVKFFDETKGWGFITRPDASELFVHYSSIQAEGFKTLQDGQVVTYMPVKTPKGWAAQEVALL